MLFGLLITAAFGATLADIAGIRNLMGEPDYRKVRLHWEGDNNPQLQYQIRYCELQTWGPQRCRLQTTYNTDNNNIEDNSLAYVADIKGLRMATTYSFEVQRHVKKELVEREERADDGGDDDDDDDGNQNIIVLPTKGFSARATQCLPHASEIEVSTGPYFGGRIAVEAADGERCALDGEPTSPRDTYTLRINHTECGSQVNETTVATFVLVQENLPILTHSTRRFLVLCSYQPETLTVRAGINLPNRHLGRGQAHISLNGHDDSDDDEDNSLKGRQGRSFRSGRLMIQKPEALVKENDEIVGISSKTNIVPILVITMLSLAGVIGIVAVVLKLASKKILKELDDVSIASEISTSSSCSTMDYNNPRSV